MCILHGYADVEPPIFWGHDLDLKIKIYVLFFAVLLQPSAVDSMVDDEDQRSIERAVSAIQAECKKQQPDKTLLCDRLKRTVGYRQKLCLEQPTREAMAAFPTLRQHYYVSIRMYDLVAIDVLLYASCCAFCLVFFFSEILSTIVI